MACAKIDSLSAACAWIHSNSDTEYQDKDVIFELASLCEKKGKRGDRTGWCKMSEKLPDGSIPLRFYDEVARQTRYRKLADIREDGQAFLIRKVQELAAGSHQAAGQAPSSDETEPASKRLRTHYDSKAKTLSMGGPNIQWPFSQLSPPGGTSSSASSSTAGHEHSSPPYYEIQSEGWCGKHALNNLFGGPFVTEEDCDRACAEVVKKLSEAGGGDVEDSSQHMHPDTGWLSIDVINVVGQANLGIHVQGHATSFDDFVSFGAGGALVNWNNQHWTALKGASGQGPWIHIDSIVAGDQPSFPLEIWDASEVEDILADIRNRCGGVSLHRVIEADRPGYHFLQREGMRAMLPKEDVLCQPCEPEAPLEDVLGQPCEPEAPLEDVLCQPGEPEAPLDYSEISLVTVNVDGLGTYADDPKKRISGILKALKVVETDSEVLEYSEDWRPPDVLLMQEVTDPMYDEINQLLSDWRLVKQKQQAEVYFNVSATKWPHDVIGRSSSFSFPSSRNGRHYVAVRRAGWAVQSELRFSWTSPPTPMTEVSLAPYVAFMGPSLGVLLMSQPPWL